MSLKYPTVTIDQRDNIFITFYKDNKRYRISNGERMELKSGDEIYLVNPKKVTDKDKHPTSLMFINMRVRFFS